MSGGRRLSTSEVAARLGVKPQTIYAYVSRGLLHPTRGTGGSTFDPLEVERLALSSRQASAAPRLQRPIAFITEVTLIENGSFYYRGLDACELAASTSFEAVAEMLWQSQPDVDGRPAPPTEPARASERWKGPGPAVGDDVAAVLAVLPAQASAVDRFKVAVAASAAADPLRYDRSGAAVAGVGRKLITLFAADLVSRSGVRPGLGARRQLPTPLAAGASPMLLAAGLLTGLSPLEATDARLAALNAALVLLADHEMAASTLAARVAAAFGADPYSSVGAALGPASGINHGGASRLVTQMLDAAAAKGVSAAVGERLVGGEAPPGFGMALYPEGDPRAACLLGLLTAVDGPPERHRLIETLLGTVRDRQLPEPNIDFALAAMSYLLCLKDDVSEALFVMARTAGWLAHILEEYRSPARLRVRAAYSGPRPAQP